MDCNSWINLAVAVGTFTAAVVALFGEHWRKRLFSPKFSAKVLSDSGELTTYSDEQKTKVLYYHLAISNSSSEIATNVVVMLTKVEEVWEGGLREKWNGRVPFTWRFGAFYPTPYKTIGANEECDLISISEKGEALLQLYYFPNNLPFKWNSKFDIKLSFQIESEQITSKEQKVHIIWDGIWESDKSEMMKHVSIKIE